MKSKYNVVIVGGGVAGLSCARELVENGIHDFVLVSKNIGGRAPSSADGQARYGAFYVRNDYKHMLKYAQRLRRISKKNFSFIQGDKIRWFYDVRNLWHAPRLIGFYRFLHRYRRHEQQFRANSERMSQVEALANDPWLLKLYRSPALEQIQQLKIEYWVRRYLNALVWSTGFLDVRETTAINFAAICLPMITPTYEFEFDKSKLLAPFRHKIRTGCADQVVFQEDGSWKVHLESGQAIFADQVVIATQIEDAKRLIPILEPTNTPVSVFMFHVEGTLRSKFGQRPFVMLPPIDEDIVIVREPNGSYLFYTRIPNPQLDEYFSNYRIIATRHWDPAFSLGSELVESNRGNGLYLIGDHNACSMEDAFITGLYAARQITRHESGCKPVQSLAN